MNDGYLICRQIMLYFLGYGDKCTTTNATFMITKGEFYLLHILNIR